jgi:hypothetical protein
LLAATAGFKLLWPTLDELSGFLFNDSADNDGVVVRRKRLVSEWLLKSDFAWLCGVTMLADLAVVDSEFEFEFGLRIRARVALAEP